MPTTPTKAFLRPVDLRNTRSIHAEFDSACREARQITRNVFLVRLGRLPIEYRPPSRNNNELVIVKKLPSYEARREISTLLHFQTIAPTLLTHFKGAGYTYLVMEYVHGTTLDAYLKSGHPLPYKKISDLIEQLCEEMCWHPDLNYGNIVVNRVTQRLPNSRLWTGS